MSEGRSPKTFLDFVQGRKWCCWLHPVTRELILVVDGEAGYYQSPLQPPQGVPAQDWVQEVNARLGLTTREAMDLVTRSMGCCLRLR
jgi:hypothetical protein